MYDPAPESPSIAHLHPSYGLFLDGKFTDPEGHASFETLNPATEIPLARVAQASSDDVGRAVASSRTRLREGLVEDDRRRASEVSLPHRATDPGTLAGVGRRRDSRQRQGHSRVARYRHSSGRGPLLLLRRLGRQARLRRFWTRPQAARRRRTDHSVELSAAHGGVEVGPGPRDGKHLRPQARRDDAPDGAGPGGDSPAGRTASGRRQHRDRRRLGRRGTRRSPRRRQDRLHRLDRSGPAHSTARRACHTST